MDIAKSIDITHPVHTMQPIDNGTLGVIDTENVIRFFSILDLKLVGGFKSNVEEIVPYVNNVGISPNGKTIIFYREGTKELLVFHVATKKFLHSIKAHDAGTECVAYSPDGRSLISGGVDGRVYMWSLQNGKKTDTFAHHTDTVSAIAFSPTGNMVATSGYDKIIKVTDRSFRNNQYRLISHQSIPTTLHFLSGRRLLSTDKEGVILVWDISSSKVAQRLTKFTSQITASTISADEQFLFVCGHQGEIGLYDLQSGEQLKQNYLNTLAGITCACYIPETNQLVCGLINSHIVMYDFAKEEERFGELLKKKEFFAACEMMENDPMLRYTEYAQKLEETFDIYFKSAKKLLVMNGGEKAAALLAPFQSSSEKRRIIQKLLGDFKHYRPFFESAKKGNYSIAYGLAESYSSLKVTDIYLAMEKKWQQVMLQAQDMRVDKEYEGKLRQLFKPFLGIAKKSLTMTSMYSNGKTVQLFKKLIGTQEFLEAFALADAYPFLKQLDEYEKILAIGELLEEQMKTAYQSGKYADAVRLSDIVADFPNKKDIAKFTRNRANIYAEAMSYYAEKKMADVYNMMEKYPYLEEAQIGIALENSFKEALNVIENFAAKGDVASIKENMQAYIAIRSKIPSIVHMIKIAYLGQLEKLCAANSPSLSKAVDTYMRYFGYDDMLDDQLSQFEGKCTVSPTGTPEARAYSGSVEALPNTLI